MDMDGESELRQHMHKKRELTETMEKARQEGNSEILNEASELIKQLENDRMQEATQNRTCEPDDQPDQSGCCGLDNNNRTEAGQNTDNNQTNSFEFSDLDSEQISLPNQTGLRVYFNNCKNITLNC